MRARVVDQRPHVLECLLPPENREGGPETRVHVETTVGASGVVHAVSGEDLSEAGRRCIEDVLARRLPLRARTESLRTAVDFVQPVSLSQSLFEPPDWQSRISGELRRALPSWCSCYDGLLEGPVAPLLGTINAMPRRGSRKTLELAVFLSFGRELPGEIAPLGACLQRRAAAFTFPWLPRHLYTAAPLRLRHLNTALRGAPAVLQPELHFFQLEGERNLYAADAARAWGRRLEAAKSYSARVVSYEASKDPEAVAGLQWRCALVVQATRAWVASLERQQQADAQLAALVGELTARSTVTPGASAMVAEAQQRTAAAMRAAQQVLQEDEAACPQSHEEPAASAGN
jgi:hypothetical protein